MQLWNFKMNSGEFKMNFRTRIGRQGPSAWNFITGQGREALISRDLH